MGYNNPINMKRKIHSMLKFVFVTGRHSILIISEEIYVMILWSMEKFLPVSTIRFKLERFFLVIIPIYLNIKRNREMIRIPDLIIHNNINFVTNIQSKEYEINIGSKIFVYVYLCIRLV